MVYLFATWAHKVTALLLAEVGHYYIHKGGVWKAEITLKVQYEEATNRKIIKFIFTIYTHVERITSVSLNSARSNLIKVVLVSSALRLRKRKLRDLRIYLHVLSNTLYLQ